MNTIKTGAAQITCRSRVSLLCSFLSKKEPKKDPAKDYPPFAGGIPDAAIVLLLCKFNTRTLITKDYPVLQFSTIILI